MKCTFCNDRGWFSDDMMGSSFYPCQECKTFEQCSDGVHVRRISTSETKYYKVAVQTRDDTTFPTYFVEEFEFKSHGLELVIENVRMFFPYANLIKVFIEAKED